MRRLVSLLLLLAVSCTTSPPTNVGDASLPTGVGIETAAALDTARAFVEAYEDPRTLAATHRRLVTGPDLLAWVEAVGVQNAGIDFLPEGEVEITDLHVVRFDPPLATVDLDAVVATRFRVDGDVAERVRRFGALLLQRLETGWRVVDAFHDERQMTSTITPFDPPVGIRTERVEIALDSVFRFTGGTVVNLRIANRGDGTLRLDLARSLLLIDEQRLPGEQLTASLDRPIGTGELVQGGLTFPAIPADAIPEAMLLRLAGSPPADVLVELPVELFQVEATGQSGSNSGGGGSSGA